MNFVWWLVVGFLAGLLARAIIPGRDPMGWFGTLVLGLAGSIVGGLIGDIFASGDQDFSPSGLIGSIIGAIIVLLIWRALMRRRATP
jgi:uncharacterized membrane protein YeaQ/YmgE (transglycosylase-associated protein family)